MTTSPPRCAYAARTDTWSTWDTDVGGMVDLPEIVATFDLRHIHTGWMKFTQGEPPDFLWDIDGAAQQRPSKDHRRGFSVHLYIDGYGLRELCANSGGLCEAISIVFDQYERDPHARQGLLPVIQTGARPKPTALSAHTGSRPFEIVDWVPRPAGLPVQKPVEPPAAGPGTALAPLGRDLDDDIPF
jgi:hypothetical protein